LAKKNTGQRKRKWRLTPWLSVKLVGASKSVGLRVLAAPNPALGIPPITCFILSAWSIDNVLAKHLKWAQQQEEKEGNRLDV
jgi:hypothetical protein